MGLFAKTIASTRRGAVGRLSLAVAVLAVLSTVFASSAGATQYQRPLKEILGPAAQPSSPWPALLAIDPTTGDVLIGDAINETISRYHADGTPAPFAALGTDVIDGKGGSKPCAEEPASCDKTPQNMLEIPTGGAERQQLAAAPNGDIYLTQHERNAVDIFSPEGVYLGQLTAAKEGLFKWPCGVAVDSTGAIYVAGHFGGVEGIAKYVPSGNTPVDEDNTAIYTLGSARESCHMAVGTKASAGFLFIANALAGGHTLKVNTATGEFSEFAKGTKGFVTVDPTTGNPIVRNEVVSAGSVEFSGLRDSVSEEEVLSPLSRMYVELASGRVDDYAANGEGDVDVIVGPSNPLVYVYGRPEVVPTVVVDPASNVSGTKATLSGTADAEGLAVSECKFEYGLTSSYGSSVACEGAIPSDSAVHPVHASLSGLTPNGKTYHYRLSVENENGTERTLDQTFVTAHTVVTDPASGVDGTAVTLNGTVRPEGLEYGECYFEYGLASKAGYEHSVLCSPTAPAIEPDFNPHAVSATLSGLQDGTTYRYRLVAANAQGALRGEEVDFQTYGPPQISDIRALDGTSSSVSLEAKIDPSGFGTSYRFEWGPTGSYGHEVPVDFEPYVGAGSEPVRVTAKLTGLTAASTYHYRLVATSSAGSTISPGQTLETLDGCGLPDGRCLEMVSPREPGLAAQVGVYVGGLEIHFQASDDPGSLAYLMQAGLPEATRGNELTYVGSRSSTGWESTQVSPGITERDERSEFVAEPSRYLGLSPDLRCGVLESAQPLTEDPVAHIALEKGMTNLYRRNPDGSYTLITDSPPENGIGPGFEHEIVGMSTDCGRIVFTSYDKYPNVVGTGFGSRLYEWSEEDGLEYAGYVPNGSGEGLVEAVPGSGTDLYHAVSSDGSRVFFTATRLVAGNPADPREEGRQGVFVREDGVRSWDVSASQTSTADTSAKFEGATPDGSRVYFTANAGLTEHSSSTGTDLYECRIVEPEGGGHKCDLTDLSATAEAGGAQVSGLVGVADDGSHVYFVAQGQLVPGKGSTLAQNTAAGTYSIYDATDGALHYVGASAGKSIEFGHLVVDSQSSTQSNMSRVSPDGRYLVFESSLDLTGYDSHGDQEVYFYDSQTESTVCVSCRQDGYPPVDPTVEYYHLSDSEGVDPMYEPQSLVIHDGVPEVFFVSPDRLAEGAVENAWNLYEWSHGQVFHISTETPGSTDRRDGANVIFTGASRDGTDLYFYDPAALNWENPQGRPAAWDARVGGGFAEPAPSAACDPMGEGSCQGAAPPPPSVPALGSLTFTGPGNLLLTALPVKAVAPVKSHSKPARHKKARKRRSGKRKAHRKSKRRSHAKGGAARRANHKGRAGR